MRGPLPGVRLNDQQAAALYWSRRRRWLLPRPAYWTPALASPQWWFDAKEASTITHVAGFVSQWDDKSGNGRHITQTTAGEQPLYDSNGGFIAPDGGDQLAFLGANGFAGNSGYVVVALMRTSTVVVATSRLWSMGADLTSAHPRGTIGAPIRHTFYNGFSAFNSPANGTDCLIAWSYPAGGTHNDATLRFNGAAATRTAIGSGTNSINITNPAVRLFGDDPGVNDVRLGAGARLYEIAAFLPGNADAATIEKVEGYMAHRHGLTDLLPATHPYKTTPARV